MKFKSKRLIESLGAGVLSVFISVYAQASEVGKPAPDFELKDTAGAVHALSAYKGKFVVLEWLNHDCPFVRKHYDSGNMQSLQKDYTGKGVIWFSVNSSAEGKQGHTSGPEADHLTQEKNAAPTAVLLDTNGEVGRLYGAKTTPHLFIVNPEGILIYKGGMDDKASVDPADIPGARNYLKQALDEALSGKPVSEAQTTPYGCSVKY